MINRIVILVGLVACGGQAAVPASPSSVPATPELASEPERAALSPTSGTAELRDLERRIKAWRIEHADLPPTAAPMPGLPAEACNTTMQKFPARSEAEWNADPGWAAIGFWVEGPSRTTYRWTRVSATEGYAVASGDFDCDGVLWTRRFDLTVDAEGNQVVTYATPTED